MKNLGVIAKIVVGAARAPEGDWKIEVALLGDTMNTTARIEGAARRFGASTVLSNAVVQKLPEAARSGLR